jgi:hypothetical protein
VCDAGGPASGDLVRAALDGFCEAILSALFMGLVIELQADPSNLDDWGETGRTLSKVLPRMTAALRATQSRRPRGEQLLLATYVAGDWDIQRLSERLVSDQPNTRCFFVFGSLVGALVVELSAAAPPN